MDLGEIEPSSYRGGDVRTPAPVTKVTLLAGTGARNSPPRHALGSTSPNSMRRLLVTGIS